MRQEWIEDLLAVLDTGSVTAAAEKRCLSQPAFTRRLRAIENGMGTELFDRTRKPLALKPKFLELEPALRNMVVRLNGLRNTILTADGLPGNRVSLGCQHTIATTVSGTLIRKLTGDGVMNVTVKANNRDACLMMLLTADVDLAMVFDTTPSTLGGEQGGFLQKTLGTDYMVPVVATEYVKELLESFEKGILRVISFPDDIYFGSLFEQHFIPTVAQNCTIVRTAETGLGLAALHYTLEGVGIGWLPHSVVKHDIKHGRLLDLSDRLPTQPLHIKIIRLHETFSPLAESAWNTILDAYGATD
ncbi:MAG: LysR family transcriptional regulator [Granulosicoccus sp.]